MLSVGGLSRCRAESFHCVDACGAHVFYAMRSFLATSPVALPDLLSTQRLEGADVP